MKLGKIVFIGAGSLIVVVALALGACSIYDVVATKSESSSLRPYGRLVPVNGKKMNVVVRGSGTQTVVLLPGYGTAAPGLDFEPMIAALEGTYRVVVVEPFGYGRSDVSDTERTTANIVGEVHTALQRLGVNRYVLMGHSIAGIYALDYVNTYRSEVSGFVGIDTSVPNQPGMDKPIPVKELRILKSLGLMRVLTAIMPDPYEGRPFTEDAKKQMRSLSLRNSFNADLASEADQMPRNFVAAQAQSFPKDLPLLLFVVDDNAEVAGWVELHEKQVAQSDRAEMVLLRGDHYLHHTQSQAMADKLAQFLGHDQPTS
ncbi:alpha/beta hydrolase [Mycolicibacterium komossense]|uniref:Alpha/beta hydrolase n=1 Tax=Mycolicibacterium komossense TaxID=1779 RepID=A0ABT3CBS9_9MYCO|nr:alpha/beta hydrolase [Mycolicibacterium komossense]MCV7226940.1 alpha/beta hydrolase [Mycolicibacterium komossense]